jgi:hypothetical protein
MNISKADHIHRIYYDARKVGPKYARQMRATLGERFKILLLEAGLSPEEAGKELHVSPRTIWYWISELLRDVRSMALHWPQGVDCQPYI